MTPLLRLCCVPNNMGSVDIPQGNSTEVGNFCSFAGAGPHPWDKASPRGNEFLLAGASNGHPY